MRTESEIRDWLTRKYVSPHRLHLTLDDIDHIAMCLYHIGRWYFEGYPLGSFLSAVVRNDFREACLRADDINQRALPIYAMFCVNHIGHDYIDKANGKLAKQEIE